LARKQVTLYLDSQVYQRFKDLLAPKPVSPEVEKVMVKMIEEIQSGEYKLAETVDYEELEKEQVKLTKKVRSLEKMLGDEYEKVRRITLRCGFNEDTLEFTPEVVKCVNATYDGPPENAHIYIQAMEVIKEKRKVENTLTEIRMGSGQ
jgi:F0F1-type ATP synthase beta subunit